MSDLLTDIESYFISKGLVTILYRDFMPNEPNDCVAAYEYEGANPLPQISGAYRPVQITVRNVNATQAKNLARQLHNSLLTENGIVNLTAERWAVLYPKQPPFKLKVDEQGRVYYVFNISIVTYND